MRTTLNIDAELLEETVRLSGGKKRSEAVEEALREYVRRRRKELLLTLPGRLQLEEDWRDLREMELDERPGPS